MSDPSLDAGDAQGAHDAAPPSLDGMDEQQTSPRAVVLEVEGMTCQHCERTVSKSLRAVGASGVRVDHTTARAHLSVADDVSDQALVDAVSEAGYTARPVSA